jgi:hypothetical protein
MKNTTTSVHIEIMPAGAGTEGRSEGGETERTGAPGTGRIEAEEEIERREEEEGTGTREEEEEEGRREVEEEETGRKKGR